jgi:hypothetical protein
MTTEEFTTIMNRVMDTTAKLAPDVKALILETIQQRDYRPADLIVELLATSRVSESQVKSGLAALVDDRIVDLTPDRYVKRLR